MRHCRSAARCALPPRADVPAVAHPGGGGDHSAACHPVEGGPRRCFVGCCDASAALACVGRGVPGDRPAGGGTRGVASHQVCGGFRNAPAALVGAAAALVGAPVSPPPLPEPRGAACPQAPPSAVPLRFLAHLSGAVTALLWRLGGALLLLWLTGWALLGAAWRLPSVQLHVPPTPLRPSRDRHRHRPAWAAALTALLTLVLWPNAEARPRGRAAPRPSRLPPEPPGAAPAVAAAADPSPPLVASPDLGSSPALTPNTLAAELALAVPELPHSDHSDSIASAPTPLALSASESSYVRSSGSHCTVPGLTAAPAGRSNRRRHRSAAVRVADDESPFATHPLPEPPLAHALYPLEQGHRSSLASFSRLRPTCSSEAASLNRLLRRYVPFANSPAQHDLRKEFLFLTGGSFRVALADGFSFTCAQEYRHSSGSTSRALRPCRIPGVTVSLDAASTITDFEAHWLRFRDLEILRRTALVHAFATGFAVDPVELCRLDEEAGREPNPEFVDVTGDDFEDAAEDCFGCESDGYGSGLDGLDGPVDEGWE